MLSGVSPHQSPRQRLARGVVYAIVLLTVIGMVVAMAGSAFGQERRRTPVVVLATTALSWASVAEGEDDLSRDLLNLAASGSPANLVPRTAGTCEADAWLSLGAGARTRASAPASTCSWPSSWNQARHASHEAGYAAEPGALADALSSAGLTVAAVGPGAELALTSSSGQAPRSAASLNELGGLAELTVVDATRHGSAAARRTLAEDLEALAASGARARVVVVSLTGPGGGPQALVLPAGSTGLGSEEGVVTSPSTHQAGLVQLTDLAPTFLEALGVAPPTSMSGRALSLPAGATDLGALTHSAGTDVPQSVSQLADDALRAKASQMTTLPAGLVIVGAAAALVLVAARTLRGPTGRRYLHGVGVAATVVGALPLGAWMGMAVPWWRVGADAGQPSWVVVPTAVLTMVITAMVAVGVLHGLGSAVISVRDRLLAARPRPPHAPRTPRSPGHGPGPLGVHGLRLPPSSRVPTPLFFTAYVLTACVAALLLSDGATGARLGFNGMLGMDAVVAGRFYGMSNTAFALAAAALVIGLAAGVSPFVEAQPTHRLRRSAAYLGVGVPGLVALALDGLPQAGADVGGAIAMAAALAALTAGLVGGRIGWKRWLTIATGAVAAAGLFGLIDRSLGSHTHMGQFIGQLQDGTASTTILRKLTALVAPFLTSRLALLALVTGVIALAAGGWWLRREVTAWRLGTSAYASLVRPEEQEPCHRPADGGAGQQERSGTVATGGLPQWLAPALKGLGTLLVIEVVVNDSGLSMACLSLACAAPLLVALVAAQFQARVGQASERAGATPSGSPA